MSTLASIPGRSAGVPPAEYVSLSNGIDQDAGLSVGTPTLTKSPENLDKRVDW